MPASTVGAAASKTTAACATVTLPRSTVTLCQPSQRVALNECAPTDQDDVSTVAANDPDRSISRRVSPTLRTPTTDSPSASLTTAVTVNDRSAVSGTPTRST